MPTNSNLITITGSTSPAYSAGDNVGGILTFPSYLDGNGGGILESIYLISKSVQTAGFKLYLFQTLPTSTVTDNAAVTISAVDLANLIGVYSLSNYDSGLGTMTIYTLDSINKVIDSGYNQPNLYGILTTTGTPTLTTTTDLSIALGTIV